MKHLRPLPPLDGLQALFDYNPETGIILRKWRTKPPSLCGGVSPNGYKTVFWKERAYAAHRVCWALHYEKDPYPAEIDHINRNRLDNRIANLRLADGHDNKHNMLYGKNKTGYRGVFVKTNGYGACIKINRKTLHLGTFSTPEEAHRAYCEAKLAIAGEFACIADFSGGR